MPRPCQWCSNEDGPCVRHRPASPTCKQHLTRNPNCATCQPDSPTRFADVQGEASEEWRVVGDPGAGFPPYLYVHPNEASARMFVASIKRLHRERLDATWVDGPRVERRNVTPWKPADDPTPADPAATERSET